MITKFVANISFRNQQNFLFPPGQIAHLHEITPTGTLYGEPISTPVAR
jgi:hypothetical protein